MGSAQHNCSTAAVRKLSCQFFLRHTIPSTWRKRSADGKPHVIAPRITTTRRHVRCPGLRLDPRSWYRTHALATGTSTPLSSAPTKEAGPTSSDCQTAGCTTGIDFTYGDAPEPIKPQEEAYKGATGRGLMKNHHSIY